MPYKDPDDPRRQKALDRYYVTSKRLANTERRSRKRTAERAAKPKRESIGREESKRRYAVSEKQAAARVRAWRRRYKVTPADILRLQSQTICMICERSGMGLVLDHRHEPHQVRDHLCRRCNILVGMVEGPLLRKAIEYVDHWNEKSQ